MNKLDHAGALELAEAEIAWWNRSAAPIKSEYATLLARAYIDLRAERELLVAVAEAAGVFEHFLSKSKRAPGRLQRTLTAWRER